MLHFNCFLVRVQTIFASSAILSLLLLPLHSLQQSLISSMPFLLLLTTAGFRQHCSYHWRVSGGWPYIKHCFSSCLKLLSFFCLNHLKIIIAYQLWNLAWKQQSNQKAQEVRNPLECHHCWVCQIPQLELQAYLQFYHHQLCSLAYSRDFLSKRSSVRFSSRAILEAQWPC